MTSSSEEVSATPTNGITSGGNPNIAGGTTGSVSGIGGSSVSIPAASQGATSLVGGSISASGSSSSATSSSSGSSTVVNPGNAPPSTTSASPSPSSVAITGSASAVGGNIGGGGSSGSASASTSSVNAGGTEQFGVFRDFDFLEYESESLEGESTDNFNWGVRRRPLSDGGESEFDPPLAPSGTRAMSLEGSIEVGCSLGRMTGLSAREEEFARLLGSGTTPLLSKRSRLAPDDSSDEEVGSESPLDETAISGIGHAPTVRSPTSSTLVTSLHHCTCNANSGNRDAAEISLEVVPSETSLLLVASTSVGLRERRRRRNRTDSGPRSDTSGSSIGDPSEVIGRKISSSTILPTAEREASSTLQDGEKGVGIAEEEGIDDDEARSVSQPGELSPDGTMLTEHGDVGVYEGGEDEDDRDAWWRRRIQTVLEDLPSAAYPARSRLLLHRSLLAPFGLLRGILRDSCERGEALARVGRRRLGCGIGVSDDLATMSSSLSSAITAVAALSRDPPSAWFGISSSATGNDFAAALGDGLRFALLEVQEHLDTFSDRKIQTVQGLRAAKAVCKSHRPSVGGAEGSETWRVELGKVLYKLLFQLLLLVEASWKAISTLLSTAGKFQLQDMSGEFAVVKARLTKAEEDLEGEGMREEEVYEEEEDEEEEESESVSMGDEELEDEGEDEEAKTLARLIQGGKWCAALAQVHRHRDIWSDECFAEDDVSLALNVYALRMVKEKRDAFVVSCPEREVPELATQLKESLLLVLGAIKGLEGRVGKRELGPLGREGGVLRRRLPRGRGIERRGRVGETGAVGGFLKRKRALSAGRAVGDPSPTVEMDSEEEEDDDDEEEDEADMVSPLNDKNE